MNLERINNSTIMRVIKLFVKKSSRLNKYNRKFILSRRVIVSRKKNMNISLYIDC